MEISEVVALTGPEQIKILETGRPDQRDAHHHGYLRTDHELGVIGSKRPIATFPARLFRGEGARVRKLALADQAIVVALFTASMLYFWPPWQALTLRWVTALAKHYT
jgi:hypothetical protein